MTTADTGYTPSYTLDNAWRDARRRLDLLEQTLDPFSLRNLDTLGVGAGWRCLEVGGGGGSIARELAERVGPEGHVTAVDIDPRFLEAIDLPNVEVERLDVVVDPLPEGGFDLVHTRALLTHLAERDAALHKLVGAVRPGGWLLVEEADLYPGVVIGTGAYGRSFELAHRPMIDAGLDPAWGRNLPSVVCAEGLDDVEAASEVLTFRGGSHGAEFVRLTYAQVLEGFAFSEPEREVLETAREELKDPDRWFTTYALIAVWGRAPGR